MLALNHPWSLYWVERFTGAEGYCDGLCCSGAMTDPRFELIACPRCHGHDCAQCDWKGKLKVRKTSHPE